MPLKIEINNSYYSHFVIIINGRRFFQCLFTEADRTKAYLWMEGYMQGLEDPDIQFDDSNESDKDLFTLVMW